MKRIASISVGVLALVLLLLLVIEYADAKVTRTVITSPCVSSVLANEMLSKSSKIQQLCSLPVVVKE